MAFTFDGANKLILCTAGTTGIVLPDLWSRYKDWLLSGNAGYAPAFDTVGGDPIDAGTLVPLYLFLENGWNIRPQEATHTLNVTDGILVVRGGGDPFVNTLGAHSVRIRYSQPVQAFGYSSTGSTGPTAGDVAAAVRVDLTSELANVTEIAKLHGLLPGIDLVVTPVSRTAGDVVQTVATAGSTTTVSRA